MPHHEHMTLTLMITLLASTTFATAISLNVYAQQEMTPTNTFETQEEYSTLAFSADGNYIAAISNKTDTLSTFNSTHMLWSTTVPGINSVAVSQNPTLIAAGADSGLYVFSIENSTPQQHYSLHYSKPLVAFSDDATTLAFAATTTDNSNTATTTLHLIEPLNQVTWNTTLQGTLESLSTSNNGNYITITTNHPGALHTFTKQQPTPLWAYTFGEQSGAAKISNDGNYIIATGGNQTETLGLRVYRFRPQSPLPNYIKIISELAPAKRLSVASQGTIFTLAQAESNRLIFFNLNLPPYGYGPGSVLNVTLPSQPTSTSTSYDGKYTAVGTEAGVYIYEYMNNTLHQTKQYTANLPFITDVEIAADGLNLAAAATNQQNHKPNAIYLFDLTEIRDGNPSPLIPIIATTIAIAGAATAFHLWRTKHKSKESIRRI